MNISLFLTIMGSLGGFVLLWGVAAKSWKYFIRARMSYLSSEKDFMYKSLEMGDRILIPNKHILQRRRFTLKALQHNVTSLRIGFGPLSVATIDVNLISGAGKLREIEASPPNGDWLDFSLDFYTPLKKNELLDFEIEAEFKAKRGKFLSNNLYFTTNRRTENLTLRVVFSEVHPSSTILNVLDSIGDKRVEETVEVDKLTREAKWNIEFPRPGLMYTLSWNDNV
jgi:hypothetical protein